MTAHGSEPDPVGKDLAFAEANEVSNAGANGAYGPVALLLMPLASLLTWVREKLTRR